MFDAHVLGNGVAAPGTASQCQGRSELEVVQVADAALGGRRVDQNTAGLHGSRMLRHLLFLVHVDV